MIVLKVDFYAELTTDITNQAAIFCVFCDKITQVPLSKQSITLSAKVKFAEL